MKDTMQIARHPQNEADRLARLRSFGILDTLPQKAFDDITALASAVCETPIALISLVDEDRQWFKAKRGLEASEMPRSMSFCSHAILEPGNVMVIEDARQDVRFSDNPQVVREPDFRFYAGAPIVTDDGFALGTVCVIDLKARPLTETQRQALQSLAHLVMSLLAHGKEQAELQAMRSSRAEHKSQLLAAITASGLDLISYIGPDLVYRYVNHRYLTYWGKKESDIVGHKVVDLVGQSLFESTVKPNLELAMAGHEVAFETSVDFSAMGRRFVEVVYLPARNEDGSVGVVVRTHDIHAIKQRKQQLRETVALLEHKTLEQERFIHIISHDLREPINTIANFAGLLAEEKSVTLPEHAQRYIHFVRSGALRAKSLLSDLLDFLHLDHHAVKRQPVDLTQLAVEVRDDLSATVEKAGGRIEFGHLPIAMGDGTLLRILLQNLVSNGLKFSSRGTPAVVEITSSVSEGTLLVQVRDNGIGIPADQTDKIFSMFTRLHSRKEYEGSGLGLSICKRIAELHGGSVSVTSEPGAGSCFTLHLPFAPATTEERNGDEYL